MIKILTINAALQDIRILGKSLYRPIPWVKERLLVLTEQIRFVDADIVCIQELFHHDLQTQLYSLLKDKYPYVCGLANKGFKLRLGNELINLSKYPITNSGLSRFQLAALEEKIFTSKGFMHCDLDLPGIGICKLYNVHMTAGGLSQHPESTGMEKIRQSQIQQLLDHLPQNLPVIIAGDFNAGPGASMTNYEELINSGLIDTSKTSEGEIYSWDPENPLVSCYRESHLPLQKPDHVFINFHLQGILNISDSKIVLNQKTVITKKGNIPISDHYGLLIKLDHKK